MLTQLCTVHVDAAAAAVSENGVSTRLSFGEQKGYQKTLFNYSFMIESACTKCRFIYAECRVLRTHRFDLIC